MNHQSIKFSDGRTFAWREAGAGKPLVLIHGWSMSSAVFINACEALANDYHVLAPDLRGHGYSSPGDGYGLDELSTDVQYWLDVLELDNVDLLGWSLGGQVSIRFAVEQPGRVNKLALVCTTPRFCNGDGWEGGLSPTQVRAMERNLKRNFAGTMGDFFFSMFAGEEHTPQFYKDILQQSVRSVPQIDSLVSLGGLMTLRDTDLRNMVSALTCPTLVHYGALDTITPRAAGDWLADNISGADSCCDETCGHAPFFSRSEETYSLWREFFA